MMKTNALIFLTVLALVACTPEAREEQKDALVTKLERVEKHLGEQIDELKEKSDDLSKDAKKEAEKAAKNLEDKRDEVRKSIKTLKKEGARQTEEAVKEAERAYDDAERSLREWKDQASEWLDEKLN